MAELAQPQQLAILLNKCLIPPIRVEIMDDAERFNDSFLRANANRAFIASKFADVLRSLMRGVAAGDASSAVYSATEHMQFFDDLLLRFDQPLTWYNIFTDALNELRSAIPSDSDGRDYISAAQQGMKYLIESTSTDGFSQARASKALDRFRETIKWSEEDRRARRDLFD